MKEGKKGVRKKNLHIGSPRRNGPKCFVLKVSGSCQEGVLECVCNVSGVVCKMSVSYLEGV